MEPFLFRLAQRIIAQHRSELDRIAVVLPGKRAALHLRKYLADVAGTTIWSPDLLDPGAFMQRLSGMRQGGSLEMLFMLHEIQTELTGHEEPLEEFLLWGGITLRDLSEVDAHLLDHALVYRDLRAYHEIEEWSFRGTPLSASQQRSIGQWTRTGELHARMSERMRTLGVGTSGAVSRAAVERVRATEQLPWAKVWFVGLNALDPSMTAIVRALQAAGKAEIAWDCDNYYLDDVRQEAGRYLRRSMKEVGPGTIPPVNTIRIAERRILATTAPDRISQVFHAAGWLSSLSPEERAATLVVMADESLLLPFLEVLPSGMGPVNVTMGIPLVQLPVNGLIEALLQLLTCEPDKYRLADLVRLLGHPFVHEGASTTALTTALQNVGTWTVDLRTIGEECDSSGFPHKSLLMETLAPTTDVHSPVRKLIAWARAVRRNDHFALEQLYHAALSEQALEQFLGRREQRISPAAYRILRSKALRDEKLDLLGEPLAGLQVMGVLETRSLDHERVLIIGANEETLPGRSALQSWIPFDLRRHYKLPLRGDAEAISAYHIHRLLHAATDVHTIGHSGGDGSGEPTRLLAQWEHDLVPVSRTSLHRTTVQVPLAPRIDASINVPKSQAVLQRMEAIASKGFSPSMLGTWLRCPLDFYFTSLLGIRRSEAPEQVLGSDVLGSAVHRTLEEVYRPSLGKPLTAELLRSAASGIHDQLELELRKDFQASTLQQGDHRLRMGMAARALEIHLHQESLRCERETTTPMALELPLTARVNEHLAVRGTCDRLEIRDGLMHVLDLKTGSARAEDLRLKGLDRQHVEPQHRYALQLLVYAYMYLSSAPSIPAVRAGIVPLRRTSGSEGLWLSIGGEDRLDRTYLEPMRLLLQALLNELMDPSRAFAHDPDSEWCKCCITA